MKAKAGILNELLEYLDISVLKFEKNIQVGNTTIDKLLKRNGNISLELIHKIRTKYPQVSEEWLRTGTGEMIINEPPKKSIELTREDAKSMLAAMDEWDGNISTLKHYLDGMNDRITSIEKKLK